MGRLARRASSASSIAAPGTPSLANRPVARRGGLGADAGDGIRALRAIGTDDNDIQRYHAYANAVLGLPYQAIYVRPLEGWKVEEAPIDPKVDPADPEAVPPVVPSRPLVPYRDFLVEYPPGFFLFAIPPALIARGLDSYYYVFSSFMALLLTAALALLWDASKRVGSGRDRSRSSSSPPPARSPSGQCWYAGTMRSSRSLSACSYGGA